MAQVIKFFGLLLLAVGGTLIVFGHLAQGFVYGWKHLATQITTDPMTSALSLLAFVPGALLYGFGALLNRWTAKSGPRDQNQAES